jgi:hypothetical protein
MRCSCPRRTNKPNVAPWPPRKRQRTPRSQLVGVTVGLGESEQWPPIIASARKALLPIGA